MAPLCTLIGNEAEIAGRIAVHPVAGIAYETYTTVFGTPNLASPALIETLLRQAAAETKGHRFPDRREIIGGAGSGYGTSGVWMSARREAY